MSQAQALKVAADGLQYDSFVLAGKITISELKAAESGIDMLIGVLILRGI